MTLKLSWAVCSAAIALSACTTPGELVKQRVAALPEAERAYAIGTYAVDCTPRDTKCHHAFNSISTYYRNVADAAVMGRLNWTAGSMFGADTVADYIWADRREKGFHFCIALPAGSYEVYTYDFYNFAGGGSGYSIREEGHFKLPFALAAGEVVDLGKLHITTSTGKNFFGMSLPAPGLLLLSTSTQEASRAALGKCPPSVQRRQVRDAALATSGYKASPFVRAVGTASPPQ